MEVQVLKQSGSGTSKIKFPEALFSKYNSDLVHQFISSYQSNSHQNTKGQKNRSSARGGGRKPWRQKGTGRARAGTIRSPIWRSGGVTFAHNYEPLKKKKKVNKKMYRLALCSILSRLVDEQRLFIIDNIELDSPPKTSEVRNLLKKLDLNKVVFVFDKRNSNFEKASGNLFNVKNQTIYSINPLQLISAEKVVFTSPALKALEEKFSS